METMRKHVRKKKKDEHPPRIGPFLFSSVAIAAKSGADEQPKLQQCDAHVVLT